ETNLEDEYTRNKIRHNILPYLTKEINKNSICHINSFMERIAAVEEYFMENIDVKIKDILEYNDLLLKANFDKTVEERYSNIFNGSEPPHKILIPDNVLKGEPDFIQGEIIKECIFILTNKKKDITSRHIESVLELFTNFSGKKVDLPYNLEALRNYAGLEIREKKNKNSDKNRENIYTISCKKFPISDIKKPITYPLSPYTKWFDYDIIQGTLSICKWSYEDTFEYAKGKRKKINRFLIDEKVEKDKRDDVYLVSDEEDVLWVVGYRQSVKYQITDKTKTILEVNIVKN
ncbi:MAG: tRNA lysidine(34) synthetase TilS, partial [Lachnospiraceae bacterium]|nr:tRNA lysidine(34) synthetase TilS [Lachnospiraceae bacterium]